MKTKLSSLCVAVACAALALSPNWKDGLANAAGAYQATKRFQTVDVRDNVQMEGCKNDYVSSYNFNAATVYLFGDEGKTVHIRTPTQALDGTWYEFTNAPFTDVNYKVVLSPLSKLDSLFQMEARALAGCQVYNAGTTYVQTRPETEKYSAVLRKDPMTPGYHVLSMYITGTADTDRTGVETSGQIWHNVYAKGYIDLIAP